MLTAQVTHIDTRKELMELEKKSFSNRTTLRASLQIRIGLKYSFSSTIMPQFYFFMLSSFFFETFYKFFDSEEIKTIFGSNFRKTRISVNEKCCSERLKIQIKMENV